MIGFSLDIDLSRPCFHVCRGTYPVYSSYLRAGKKKDCRRGCTRGGKGHEAPGALSATSWRLFKFKTARDRSPRSRPWLLRVPSSFNHHPSISLFRSSLLRRPDARATLLPPSLSPLIPGSCRSSPRPARPSKNSLTCLADSPSLSPCLLTRSQLLVQPGARRVNEERRRLGPGCRNGSHRFSLLSSRPFVPLAAVCHSRRTSRVASVPSCTF